MARTPSTSDLCNAEANKAYDVLAVISENIDKLNNLSNFIFDLKDWLKFNIGIYLNDYIIELETKCGELQVQFDHLKDVVESNKEEVLRVIDGFTDEVATLENQVNNILLHTFNKDDDTFGATCKAISDYIEDRLQNSFLPQIKRLLVPAGTIVIWSGSSSNIPSGWYLCDGSNGTPDLRGRFILGSSSTHLSGSTGGSSTYSLGDHFHVIGGAHSSNGGHFFGDYNNAKDREIGVTAPICRAPGAPTNVGWVGWNGSGSTNGWQGATNLPIVDGSLITSGPAPANVTTSMGEMLPPYYSLCYIMKA